MIATSIGTHVAYVSALAFTDADCAARHDAGAARRAVEGFWMDVHPVTVAEFRRFVKSTGYVTLAERVPDADAYPDADPSQLVPGSIVFRGTRGPVSPADHDAWWAYVPWAKWTRPEGRAATRTRAGGSG